jgi:hypothetical protein
MAKYGYRLQAAFLRYIGSYVQEYHSLEKVRYFDVVWACSSAVKLNEIRTLAHKLLENQSMVYTWRIVKVAN